MPSANPIKPLCRISRLAIGTRMDKFRSGHGNSFDQSPNHQTQFFLSSAMHHFPKTLRAINWSANLRLWPNLRAAICCCLAFAVQPLFGADSNAQESTDIPMVEPFLISGDLQAGRAALEKRLSDQPDDDQARFGLGVVQFMQAVELLGQSAYRYGVNKEMARNTPFLRFPVPNNEAPDSINYSQAREVLEKMESYLDETEQTLAVINDSDVRLPLHLFQFHIKFDQDSQTGKVENVSDILIEYIGYPADPQSPEDIVIVFDQADVYWLRGYCCMLRASINVVLAHDEEKLWDVIAYRMFTDAEVRFDFLREEREKIRREADDPKGRRGMFSYERNDIFDLIGAIHNLNFPLTDAARMRRAHALLKETIGHSRAMWAAARQESDNDREWIPDVDQQCPIVRADITPKMLESWDAFLDESEAILDGRKLLPFWRGTDKTRGINLYKVFNKPQDLDIVLWVHGSATVPFLENGDVTDREFWEEMQQNFDGNFFFFATWFN